LVFLEISDFGFVSFLMSSNLTILFEDNHCIAVAKPGALLTQGVPPGIPTLEAMVKEYLKITYAKAGNVYLGIPHRLDRPVSGVVIFARSSKAARRLAEQFRERTVKKIYWALVEGDVEPDEGQWEDWLVKKAEEARTERAEASCPGARHAVLRYRELNVKEGVCWLEVELETGRMHQIRVQSATRGHPVLGDLLYGATQQFGPLAELPRDRVIALHARELTFLHPIRYEPITLRAPVPDYWPEWVGDTTISMKRQSAEEGPEPNHASR
jgi:23S rRNA pseudouridine1911/1915/1917 synthase